MATTDPVTHVIPLFLPPELFARIQAEGKGAYPNECCGLLIGHDGAGVRIVERLVPASNAFEAGEQHHRFSIDPLVQMWAEREAGEAGKLVLGFYHSHPDHPARPSEYDRQHAWPFYSYVIVAISKGEAVDLTSWVLDAGTEKFVEQEVRR